MLLGRLAATAQDCGTYLQQIETGPRAELMALCAELTVGETYFLRHLEQFDALIGTVVPERLSQPGRTEGLQLLSAGCASGEEAYSLAIALREGAPAAAHGASILGVDINPGAVQKARKGRYTAWSMRSVSPSITRRWFTTEGPHVILEPAMRDRASFQQLNLAQADATFWQPDRFDVVFCRNVLMYFSLEVMSQVVGRIAQSLKPGGYLFLGSAETLRHLSDDFDLRESHGTFFYQLKPSVHQPQTVLPPITVPGPDLITLPPPEPVSDLPTSDLPGSETALPARHQQDFGPVMELLRQERFTDALAALNLLQPPVGAPESTRSGAADTGAADTSDDEVLLLRATLMAQSGDFAGAEHTAQHHLLGSQHLGAEAHALLAICRESEAEIPAAISHCRAAIRLSPRFAMSHLHLGRLSQRTGDLVTAQREYTESARLLADETEFRVLLFGGGFDREALISLCRTQSRRIGAA